MMDQRQDHALTRHTELFIPFPRPLVLSLFKLKAHVYTLNMISESSDPLSTPLLSMAILNKFLEMGDQAKHVWGAGPGAFALKLSVISSVRKSPNNQISCKDP